MGGGAERRAGLAMRVGNVAVRRVRSGEGSAVNLLSCREWAGVKTARQKQGSLGAGVRRGGGGGGGAVESCLAWFARRWKASTAAVSTTRDRPSPNTIEVRWVPRWRMRNGAELRRCHV